MRAFERLMSRTAEPRQRFLSTPVLQQALESGIDRALYLAYLAQAYHHVRYTCPLLAMAAGRTRPEDERLRNALFEYIEEEKGHEHWILADIEALGGDAAAAVAAGPNDGCRTLVGYVAYAIEHVSPYAVLGMVHVLEGTSVALADRAANSIRRAIADDKAGVDRTEVSGFSYLTSHGSLDIEHVAFFEKLVDGIECESDLDAIVETARIVYRCFGDMMTQTVESLAMAKRDTRHVA